MSMKKIFVQYEMCEDMKQMVKFNDELEQLGMTRNWYGFRVCRFYWDCPHRATCKKHYIPIKRII